MDNNLNGELVEIDSTLREQINNLSEKIKNGRIKDPVNEEIKIKQLKTLGTLITIRLKVLDLKRTGEIERRMEILESTMKKE